MRIRPGLLALVLAGSAAPGIAQGFADPAEIDREVAAFLGVAPSDAGTAFIPVDRRLRLTPCAQPLALAWQGTRGDSVLVQCPGGWKIYVRTVTARAGPAMTAVKRGQSVTVAVEGAGFSVSQSAQALEDGAVGDWVRVRVGKDSELQAQVTRPGAVALSLR